MSAAIDAIDHSVPLSRLGHLGVSGLAHRWLKCYLSNRFQFVSASGSKSKLPKLDYGVPQGSVLGPIFLVLARNLFHRSYSTIPIRTNSLPVTLN